jgi:hypothetical protein
MTGNAVAEPGTAPDRFGSQRFLASSFHRLLQQVSFIVQ